MAVSTGSVKPEFAFCMIGQFAPPLYSSLDCGADLQESLFATIVYPRHGRGT
jgi:hypothetical protein